MDKNTIEVCRKNINLNKLPNVTQLVNAAIFSDKKTKVFVHKSWVGSIMDTVTTKSGGIEAEPICFDDVLNMSDNLIIDFLKVDIEGGEKFIFVDAYKNLFKKRVRYITMESHSGKDFDSKLPINYLKDLGFKVKFQMGHHPYLKYYLIQAFNPSL